MIELAATTELQAATERAGKAVEEVDAYSLWTIDEFQKKYERDYELLWKHYETPEVKEVFGRFELIWQGNLPSAGYVYCATDQLGHYKIGKTKHPQPRIKSLGTQPPFKVKVLFTHYVFDAYKYETLLHKHFAAKRMNGEWFELSEGDLEEVKTGSWVGIYRRYDHKF